MDARYLTKKDTAVYLTVSERQVDYLRTKGLVPYIRLGGRVMFDRVKLDKIMQAHEVTEGA